MRLDMRTWPFILEECQDIFDEEPMLELALGPVVKDVTRGTIRPMIKVFFMKNLFPFWFIIKKTFHLTKNKIKNIENINTEKPCCVFCLTTTRDNNFNAIYPVIKKTSETGENIVVFTYNKVYVKKNKELTFIRNMSVIFFENLIYNLTIFEIFFSFIKANRLYKKFLKNLQNKDISAFVKKHRNIFLFRLEELLVDSYSLYRFFENKKCRFIFSWGGFFPFSIVANKYNIRNIMIQHGIYSDLDESIEQEIPPPESSPHAADEIITWGEHGKKMLNSLYNDKLTDKIFVLGDPRQDIILKKYVNQKRDKSYYDELKIDHDKKTVTFFSGTPSIDEGQPPERYIQAIYALDELYEHLNHKINLIIKLHPHETNVYYQKYLKNFDKIPIIKNEYPLYKVLQHVDISVTVESSTLLESMVFKIPTLQLSLTKYGVRSDYYKHDASILIKNIDEFIETVDSIISDKYDLSKLNQGQKKFLENNFSNLGCATEKIVEHLLKK